MKTRQRRSLQMSLDKRQGQAMVKPNKRVQGHTRSLMRKVSRINVRHSGLMFLMHPTQVPRLWGVLHGMLYARPPTASESVQEHGNPEDCRVALRA